MRHIPFPHPCFSMPFFSDMPANLLPSSRNTSAQAHPPRRRAGSARLSPSRSRPRPRHPENTNRPHRRNPPPVRPRPAPLCGRSPDRLHHAERVRNKHQLGPEPPRRTEAFQLVPLRLHTPFVITPIAAKCARQNVRISSTPASAKCAAAPPHRAPASAAPAPA